MMLVNLITDKEAEVKDLEARLKVAQEELGTLRAKQRAEEYDKKVKAAQRYSEARHKTLKLIGDKRIRKSGGYFGSGRYSYYLTDDLGTKVADLNGGMYRTFQEAGYLEAVPRATRTSDPYWKLNELGKQTLQDWNEKHG